MMVPEGLLDQEGMIAVKWMWCLLHKVHQVAGEEGLR